MSWSISWSDSKSRLSDAITQQNLCADTVFFLQLLGTITRLGSYCSASVCECKHCANCSCDFLIQFCGFLTHKASPIYAALVICRLPSFLITAQGSSSDGSRDCSAPSAVHCIVGRHLSAQNSASVLRSVLPRWAFMTLFIASWDCECRWGQSWGDWRLSGEITCLDVCIVSVSVAYICIHKVSILSICTVQKIVFQLYRSLHVKVSVFIPNHTLLRPNKTVLRSTLHLSW